jgi:hypothetical protein
MLHLQRTSKVLIRIVLLLLFVQFVTPAFVQVGSQDNAIHEKNSYKPHHDSGITLSVFLKGNSEEKSEADEKSHLTTALIDFSFHAIALTQSHTNNSSHFCNERLITGPLFKLHCVFLI